ncbi:hypothetical protein A9G24_09685 [Gilliamella sp. App6-5]|uniref:hypothetical protein n=2 Tax=Gilliamella sp. App6-5 TaxID=3120232 RepID=UPI00080E4A6C|nr:hypothetical protein [Gilliamella apicola]OCG11119.1 hypothetical protein A9G24_09685 [Gilliamella apicola]
MFGFHLYIIKKNISLAKTICLLYIFLNFSYVHAKDINQAYWILDKYIENDALMNKNDYNSDYLNNLRVKLIDNIIYINNNQYNVSVHRTSDISQLLTKNLIENPIINEFILPSGDLNYLQFDDVVDVDLAKLLLPKHRLIFGKEQLLFINESLVASFLKPKNKYSFQKISNKFPSLNLPINSQRSEDFVKDENYYNYPQNISRSFAYYLKLFDNDNLYGQLNNYLINLNGIKLPQINNTINPILIIGTQENEEQIVYLYLLSEQFDFLDKITLSSRIGMTRHNPAKGDLPIGFIGYNINKNYFIERRQRFEDETIEVQHFQVTKEGKFQELPVTSNCYIDFATKDKNKHSAKSLLLTSKQANNYLRFDGGKLDEFDRVTLTLNPNEEKLCVNYQQAYSISFGKVNSKRFFDNNELYQQYIENFKSYDIDISNELEYITIHGFEKTPFSKFLLNGNQAIYMKNTLFFVSENHFTAYRQPTDEELTYQQ